MFKNLVAEQARAGFTNADVAKILKISRRTYEAKKKSGRFVASECFILCKLFDTTFEYLFKNDEAA